MFVQPSRVAPAGRQGPAHSVEKERSKGTRGVEFSLSVCDSLKGKKLGVRKWRE